MQTHERLARESKTVGCGDVSKSSAGHKKRLTIGIHEMVHQREKIQAQENVGIISSPTKIGPRTRC